MFIARNLLFPVKEVSFMDHSLYPHHKYARNVFDTPKLNYRQITSPRCSLINLIQRSVGISSKRLATSLEVSGTTLLVSSYRKV